MAKNSYIKTSSNDNLYLEGNFKDKNDLFLLVLNIYFILSYISIFISDIRYAKYALPIVVSFLVLQNKKNRIVYELEMAKLYLKYFLYFYVILYLVYFFFQGVFGNNLSFRSIANALFVILPILTVYLLAPLIKVHRIDYYFKYITFLTIGGYVLEKRESLLNSILEWRQIFSAIEDSSVSSESNLYPFLLSLLLLYSFYYKIGWKYSLLILIFVILGFKRIVLLSILVAYCLYKLPFLYRIILSNIKFFSSLFSLIAVVIILFYYNIADGQYDDYLFNNFGIYTNAFMQGRQNLYALVIKELEKDNLIFGSGVGSVDNILIQYGNEINNVTNLHSELLRWFLELGIIGYTIWLFMFFKSVEYSRYIFIMFIFLFILLITDNVMIYFDYMMYYYILSVFSILKEKKYSSHEYFSRLQTEQKKY
ncbi:hypothetical protein BWI96_12130 [Siphonobacter sp. SORGH_AS_0500]|uniref:O-antigen ligase family protein n=1 Tax=Siphonobacter sp. SORGH_AS_0500 TaxID=1864824 RepID=UPI000CB264B8|nr:O-antigen ligase family protein [Siphonobacter sp. SORGH_AS_0500]PKK36158.1 hypothetical protein BWI96_12130 [Siphonobacter sp. SORGH_AS_0500]